GLNSPFDNTRPFIQILTPTNGSLWNTNFNLNITYQNTRLNISKYNITNSTGGLIQSGTNNSVYDNYYQFTDSVNVAGLADDNYTITAYAKDSVGYESTEQSIFIVDKTDPLYSNIVEYPTDPATYSPSQNYQFNITWTDTHLDEVILEFDGTNYTDAVQNGNVFSKTFGPLATGTHNYTWYANDTLGNQNNTGLLSYNISQATTILTLTIDQPSWSVINGTQTNVSCYADNAVVNISLYRNDSLTGSSV
ncbi:unnamed protein product, partial [marine sediment metagenome]